MTVTIVALAAEEAITATTHMDRFDALGDILWRTGSGGRRGGVLSLAIGTTLYGLAAIAFSLAVRAAG